MSDEDMSDDQESVQRKSYSNLQDLLKDGDGDEEESSEEETQASQDGCPFVLFLVSFVGAKTCLHNFYSERSLLSIHGVPCGAVEQNNFWGYHGRPQLAGQPPIQLEGFRER
jgi:hypothetical protein